MRWRINYLSREKFMSTQSSGNASFSDTDWIILFIGVVLLIFMGWAFFHTGFVRSVITVSVWELRIAGLFSSAAAWQGQQIATLDPSRVTVNGAVQILGIAGRYIRWVVIPIMGVFAVYFFVSSPKKKYRRRMNFAQLMPMQAQTFPVILPAVRSRLSYDFRLDDKHPWRKAYTPIEWAQKQGCLKGQPDENGRYRFDAKLCWRAYAAELEPWGGIERMSVIRFALAVVFADWIDGGYKGDKYARSGGSRLLHALNTSFYAFEIGGNPVARALYRTMRADINPGIEKRLKSLGLTTKPKPHMRRKAIDIAVREFQNRPELRQLIEDAASRHAFELPVLLDLWQRAANLMKLPSSAFIWLRPLDRRAWYAINAMGRPGAWPESAGIVAHFRSEVAAGKKITRPSVDAAQEALKKALDSADYLILEDN